MLFDYDMVALTMDVIGEIVISEDIHVCGALTAFIIRSLARSGRDFAYIVLFSILCFRLSPVESARHRSGLTPPRLRRRSG